MSLIARGCPDTVRALNAMSVLNPKIRHVAIDGALFQAEVEGEGDPSGPGRSSSTAPVRRRPHGHEQILAKLDTGAGAQAEVLERRRAVRRAGRRRRPGRRGGGDLRRAQGHPHRPRHRAFRRPGAGPWRSRTSSVEYTEGPKLASLLEAHAPVELAEVIAAAKPLHRPRDGELVGVALEPAARRCGRRP